MTEADRPASPRVAGLDLSVLAAEGFSTLLDAAPVDRSGFRQVRVDRLVPDPDQPRRHFDEDALAELAESIRAHGILQPLVARQVGDVLMIAAGERRWRAAKAAGLSAVSVFIRNDLGARAQMVENLQREDLTPFEIHRVIAAELEAGATQAELCAAYGKSKAWMSQYAAISKMPSEFQHALRDGRVRDVHALAELFRLYRRAPEDAAALVRSEGAVTRHSVAELAARLVRGKAPAKRASAPSSALPTADPAALPFGTSGAFGMGPPARVEADRAGSAPAETELPVEIQVRYCGALHLALYDRQDRLDSNGPFAGRPRMALRGLDGRVVMAPLAELELVRITDRSAGSRQSRGSPQ